ncbi:hypothetical protein WNY37_03770 [Henriciella sp. AS95]|uniref:hypothetical protein n=1 Tax=Henriciella sp. AS95 TaxID=3135782 RepID=UPI00317BD9FF
MRIMVLTLAALALVACGKSETPDDPAADTETATTAEASDVATQETAAPNPLDAGQYCYFRDDVNVTEGLEVTVADNGIVTGTNFGQIHQEAAGYFASFDTQLTNGVQGEGDEVTFDHVTKVDGDTQTGRVMWTLTPDVAAPDGLETKLTAADCDGLMDRIFPVIDEE